MSLKMTLNTWKIELDIVDECLNHEIGDLDRSVCPLSFSPSVHLLRAVLLKLLQKVNIILENMKKYLTLPSVNCSESNEELWKRLYSKGFKLRIKMEMSIAVCEAEEKVEKKHFMLDQKST